MAPVTSKETVFETKAQLLMSFYGNFHKKNRKNSGKDSRNFRFFKIFTSQLRFLKST